MLESFLSLPLFVALSIVTNSLMFLGCGGILHRAYYVRRAGTAHLWRIQADRPLPTRAEMVAKLRAVAPNLVIFNAVVGVAVWAIATGRSLVVFDAERHGVGLLVLTAFAPPVVFHVLAFLVHRLFHTPFLFRRVHSVHHRARTPVFLDGLVMHPFEAVYSAATLVAPAFLVPTHVIAFAFYFVAVGLHELIDHSGIRLHLVPMSPAAHHDEHHRGVKRCYGQTFTWIDAWLRTGVPADRVRGST